MTTDIVYPIGHLKIWADMKFATPAPLELPKIIEECEDWLKKLPLLEVKYLEADKIS